MKFWPSAPQSERDESWLTSSRASREQLSASCDRSAARVATAIAALAVAYEVILGSRRKGDDLHGESVSHAVRHIALGALARIGQRCTRCQPGCDSRRQGAARTAQRRRDARCSYSAHRVAFTDQPID